MIFSFFWTFNKTFIIFHTSITGVHITVQDSGIVDLLVTEKNTKSGSLVGWKERKSRYMRTTTTAVLMSKGRKWI
jgi:hypothetical protein